RVDGKTVRLSANGTESRPHGSGSREPVIERAADFGDALAAVECQKFEPAALAVAEAVDNDAAGPGMLQNIGGDLGCGEGDPRRPGRIEADAPRELRCRPACLGNAARIGDLK